MKHLIAFLAGTTLATALAAPATFGQHGMVLFGGSDGLYASHLPMFHAPHDHQVILKVHVADPALDAALKRRLDSKAVLWTIAPEKFELDRLAPKAANPLRSFKADLVLGHFERGGATEYAGAKLVVDQVLVYRPLSPAAARAATARYLQVGGGARRFLVKEIDSRPDYDHIVAVSAAPGTPAAPLVLAKTALTQPDAAQLDAALPGIKSGATIYFDTADLK